MEQKKEELLEIWDWDTARPTGEAVSRSLAHRDGIPHEGVHLWIIRDAPGEPQVLFQHRAAHKDMYPDCLDITVGGHVPFGTTELKIQKESREELGIEPPEESLIDLGYFRYEERSEHFFHREFQRVYLLRDNRPLNEYRFTDSEVVGLYAVGLQDIRGLFTDDLTFIVEGFDGESMLQRTVSRRHFHPLLFAPSMEEYVRVLLQAIGELHGRGMVLARMPAPL